MNDKAAARLASKLQEDFWQEFDDALQPKFASKLCYKKQLEEVIYEAEIRLEAVTDELEAEGEGDEDEDGGDDFEDEDTSP